MALIVCRHGITNNHGKNLVLLFVDRAGVLQSVLDCEKILLTKAILLQVFTIRIGLWRHKIRSLVDGETKCLTIRLTSDRIYRDGL